MQKILELLSDNEFHSGDQLGQLLGVTRAAVWKKIKKLEEIGIVVHSVKGRGYRLPKPIELLSYDALLGCGLPVGVNVDLPFNTESTNTDAKASIVRGDALPLLVAAERQTKGKGRRGRQWESGVARNLVLSFAYCFDNGPNVIEGLSLAAGVAVARVLKKAGVPNPALKWPNDIQVDGKKICGILVEMVADQDTCHVIIGIGLNIEMEEALMERVDQPWTDLYSKLGFRPSRNAVLADLTAELLDVCSLFEDGNGMKHFQHHWQAYDVLYNQSVTIHSVNRQRHGIARGIDEKGALLLEEDGQLVKIHGGEVSVRRS